MVFINRYIHELILLILILSPDISQPPQIDYLRAEHECKYYHEDFLGPPLQVLHVHMYKKRYRMLIDSTTWMHVSKPRYMKHLCEVSYTKFLTHILRNIQFLQF